MPSPGKKNVSESLGRAKSQGKFLYLADRQKLGDGPAEGLEHFYVFSKLSRAAGMWTTPAQLVMQFASVRKRPTKTLSSSGMWVPVPTVGTMGAVHVCTFRLNCMYQVLDSLVCI